MNEKVILLEFKNSEDFDPTNTNGNVLIAAFCILHMLGKVRIVVHNEQTGE